MGKTNADYGEDEPPSGTRLRSYLVSNVKILDYFLPYCYLFGEGGGLSQSFGAFQANLSHFRHYFSKEMYMSVLSIVISPISTEHSPDADPGDADNQGTLRSSFCNPEYLSIPKSLYLKISSSSISHRTLTGKKSGSWLGHGELSD